ncbi:helix-turn-helix transcriptional regulator [Dysosmobacter sp.]|uniref:helix-turn-helix domain-containing protein n=2 Tax=Clostridia TaxID=186801 RepID=UPI002A80EFB7|nr:helix-turn-helix transcriptional regulator [Dysosmobacter sp.]MDY3653061.1 helix-turn-helix transcriptional regulator [Dysosmobacter sp.]
MTLGQRISLYRKKLNISQEELGARLGVSRQAVSKWETDLSTPDLNNLIGLARELGVSVAELTETPEEPSAAQDPALPPSPSQLETDASRRNASGTRWWAGLIIGAVLLFLSAGYLLYRINQPPAGQVSDYAEPASDFYLQWQVPRTDGREWYEFLTLGNQDVPFPFHTSLHLTAPEKIVTEGTDLHLAAVHHAVCGGLYVDYIHLQADPEQGQAAGDTICRISTMAPGFWTPRGISVGNEKSFVVDAYHSGKEDQAEGTLLYGLKEADGYSLVPHDYLYIWSAFEEGRGYQTIYFFIKDGLVAGISMELMQDMGDFYASANNTSTFPVDENGDPDFSHRQDLPQEPIDATRQVYIAWNQLVTNENLSAEERYAYRRDVFTNLPDMDWQEFGKLGGIDSSGTIFALLDWLSQQEHYSSGDIYFIQRGYAARGIDGAYAEDYCYLLSRALFSDPVAYAKALARSTADDEAVQTLIMGGTAYGADYYPADCETAVSALDAAINANALTAEETGWAKLLRYYLANPNDGYYADYPKTPAELEN